MLEAVPLALILISAVLSYFLTLKSRLVGGLSALALTGVSLVVNTYLLIAGGKLVVGGGALVFNGAYFFISELILFLGFLTCLYSLGYLEGRVNLGLYLTLHQLLLGSMMGLASSFNVLVMDLFLETATVTSALLILFAESENSVNATCRYLVLSMCGTLVILAGILWQYTCTGCLTVFKLESPCLPELKWIAILYLLGFGVKAGLAPIGLLWLPPAHSEAPTPISVSLSSLLVQIAAFNIIRVCGGLGIYQSVVGVWVCLGIGIASMLSGSLAMIAEAWGRGNEKVGCQCFNFRRDVKRVWAFSTISEVGYLVMALGLAGLPLDGSTSRFPLLLRSIEISLIHLFNHGLAKAQLFLDSGVIALLAGSRDLSIMGRHLLTLERVRSMLFIVPILTLGLLPFTPGFKTFSELVLPGDIPLFVKSVVGLTALLTVVGGLSTWYRMFLQKTTKTRQGKVVLRLGVTIPGYVLGVILLALGVLTTLNLTGVIPLEACDLLGQLAKKVSRGVFTP